MQFININGSNSPPICKSVLLLFIARAESIIAAYKAICVSTYFYITYVKTDAAWYHIVGKVDEWVCMPDTT